MQVASTETRAPRLAFDVVQQHVSETFMERLAEYGPNLFYVDSDGLFNTYIYAFDDEIDKQEHNCSTCAEFIRKYGNLVFITEDGTTVSAMWDSLIAPSEWVGVVKALETAVETRPVEGMFYTDQKSWGVEEAGGWKHFHIGEELISGQSFYRPQKYPTPSQLTARKKASFVDLNSYIHGMIDGSRFIDRASLVITALTSARAGVRKEHLEWIKWLHALVSKTDKQPNPILKNNIVWKAIASVGDGWCHVSGSIFDRLLGMKDPEQIIRVYNSMVSPEVYQRPQAVPSAGNIDHAEKLIKELGLESALERRYATLEEVIDNAIWQPTSVDQTPKKEGVFAHLREENQHSERVIKNLPSNNITWVKFVRDILPNALEIHLEVGVASTGLTALTGPTHAGAGRLFEWDNPYAHFIMLGNVDVGYFGLGHGAHAKVLAILPLPETWGKQHDGIFEKALFVLEDSIPHESIRTLALFPESLREELYPIRSTIEMFSKKGKLSGLKPGVASGIGFTNNPSVLGVVRVKDQYGTTRWVIDRIE